MVGQSHLPAFLDEGLKPGSGDVDLRLGAVKLMLSLTTGTLQPGHDELRETVLRTHEMGFQLAIHAVEEEAVEAAADALLSAQAALPRADARHRIEHCSECPPTVLEKLKASGAVVVTQPAFIYHNGEKYLALVDRGLPAISLPGRLDWGGGHPSRRRVRRSSYSSRSPPRHLLCRDPPDAGRLHHMPVARNTGRGGAEAAQHKRGLRSLRGEEQRVRRPRKAGRPGPPGRGPIDSGARRDQGDKARDDCVRR